MLDSALLLRLRNALMSAVALAIWALVLMLYTDRFVFPFSLLEPGLMPWKALHTIPQGIGVEGRLFQMQRLLDASQHVARVSFWVMAASFLAMSVYLTVIYQQRKRRIRENEMLTLKNVEIMRRNEFIRYISATIGHEFKNNLGRIKRRINLLDLPEPTRRHIDSNFEKLFSDIEIFKRIANERESGLVSFEPVDIRALVGSMASEYADLAEITLEDSHAHQGPVIFAAPALLRTVFENLLDNAVKYKAPQDERARVRISCGMDTEGQRRYLTVSLRDEGMGMDDQQADQCFYKQQSSDRGWGQGLNFAKYVVGLHAGKIRVGKEYTAPGRGTEIIIKLPYIQEEARGV